MRSGGQATHSPLTTRHSPLATHHSHCSLLTAHYRHCRHCRHCLLLTAHCSLLTAHCSLLTTPITSTGTEKPATFSATNEKTAVLSQLSSRAALKRPVEVIRPLGATRK